jgi:hypothetical protein
MEYKIQTIQEMMEIPLEKFNGFLLQLCQGLMVARTAHSYNKAMGAKSAAITKPFTWIDDGKGELKTNIVWKTQKRTEKRLNS